jgi:hypothetical protein
VLVKLLHIANDQIGRFFAACSRWARELCDWYQRPSTSDLRGWCFVPKDNLVAGDVMLAQKIALETDERGALAVARNFLIR